MEVNSIKNGAIPAIVLGVIVAIGLMVGVGYVMDASDGSIDAFDDQKWEATGNDGVRESLPADEPESVAPTLAAKRAAYDFGVEYYRSDSTVCPAMIQIHDQAVGYLTSGLDADGYLRDARAAINRILTDAARAEGHDSQSRYVVSGFWDEISRRCPQALFDANIAGRP